MTNPDTKPKPRAQLKLWQTIAISVGFMGPTMAMSLNGIGVADTVGAKVPLVFLIAFAGAGTVGYGFVRLTSYFNHAGSLYGLVGITAGPRAGFFGGWALLGTYVGFATCTLGACGVFFNALTAQLGFAEPVTPWLVVAIVAAGVVLFLNTRESNVAANVLLAIGGVGIAAMVVLAVVIFGTVGSGNAPGTQTMDIGATLTPGDVPFSVLMTASVWAFLSWAGFESCSSLGEETQNPRHTIPRAVAGAVILGGVLYVFMMIAQTIGFGTDAAGTEAFASSTSSITDLASTYIAPWFSVLLAFTAFAVALASTIGSSASAARLLFALARDGFGPKPWSAINRHGVPGNAVITIVGTCLTLCVIFGLLGVSAFDVYYWFATIATLCMLVAYSVAAVGVIYFTLRGNNKIRKWEIIIPLLSIGYLMLVFTQQLSGEPPYTYFPWIAAAWLAIGVAVILFAPGIAARIGQSLTEEAGETAHEPTASDKGAELP